MTFTTANPEYFSDVNVEDIDKMVTQLGPDQFTET